MPTSNKYFPHRMARTTCRRRIFCLPHAGGGASVYRDWQDNWPADTEVCAFELPGRETRCDEPPLTDIDELVDAFLLASEPLRDKPFVLLGHSFGALAAAEVALRLDGVADVPTDLVVCGCAAPKCPPRFAPISHLGRDRFMSELRSYGGMNDAVLDEPELLDALLPVLRADCGMAEAWWARAKLRFRRPLNCRILAVGGRADPFVDRVELQAWQDHTTVGARILLVDGDHFFVQAARPLIIEALLYPVDRQPAACPSVFGEVP